MRSPEDRFLLLELVTLPKVDPTSPRQASQHINAIVETLGLAYLLGSQDGPRQ